MQLIDYKFYTIVKYEPKLMATKNDNIQSDKLWPLIILSTIIIILWAGSYFFIYNRISNWPARGTFGDSFGAINALFSGLAFGGIIYTILLQRKELTLQRQELSETRKELQRSADAQEKSEKALTEQIESMKVSAKLNALNSLVEAYSNEENKMKNVNLSAANRAKVKKDMFLTEIENTLKKIEKPEL